MNASPTLIPKTLIIFASLMLIICGQAGWSPARAAASNPCSEGQFLDITAGVCRSLAKEFGFQQAEFDDQFREVDYHVNSCTEDELEQNLSSAALTGGTVWVPECEILISKSITVPDNVILQGAGMDRTILKAQATFTGNMIRSKQSTNVIIRDISLDGSSTDSTGIVVWYVKNVLIERVRVHHNGRSGITFRYAHQVTIRYSISHDHTTWHGINSKDCFPGEVTPDIQECRIDAGDVAPGVLFSRHYALYSNQLYNNGDYGINTHASWGEIAGNVSEKNRHGSKFPDTTQLWIHHNRFSDNANWGSRVYNTLDRSARTASNLVFYENYFSNNGDYPVRIREPAQNVYLFNNMYEGNIHNRLRIRNASVSICPETAETALLVDGDAPVISHAEQCDLSRVSELFPVTTVYMPLRP